MKRFYAQYNLDEFLNKTYIKDRKNGNFVECGASDGIEESSCLFFEEELKWTGINIEPVPFLFENLKVNRPKAKNYSYALYNEDCLKEFTHAVHPLRGKNFGNGSLNHKNFHYDELVKMGCTFEKYLVNCTTFDKVYKEAKKKKEIDLFVLDIEGGEIEAIEGILLLNKKFYPKIFVIEHTMVGFDALKTKLNDFYLFSQVYFNNSIFLKRD